VALLQSSSSAANVGISRSVRTLGLEVAAELYVGAAAGHVRRDRHGARPAGLHDDLGLALVEFGVQHLVRDLLFLE
jgi:hypothetical protein